MDSTLIGADDLRRRGNLSRSSLQRRRAVDDPDMRLTALRHKAADFTDHEQRRRFRGIDRGAGTYYCWVPQRKDVELPAMPRVGEELALISKEGVLTWARVHEVIVINSGYTVCKIRIKLL